MQTLKDEVRNNIIAAAVREFDEQGYEKASMRTIAKAAGISVSNTYNYYPGKEQLFSSIVEPVFNQVKELFRKSMQESLKQGLSGSNFQSFIDGVVASLLQMDARQRQLLIILTEKSAGTRYEKAKEEMVGLMRMHLTETVRQPGSTTIKESQGYMLSIIAANYIDGLLKILQDYRSKEWAEENLRVLLTYHVNGIKALM
ncbi:MAG: TetR/AcrR family transcriptional regulator [Dehalococcoidales bacterium]|nr:TetR/AcrR family transcriptional regulator [Dehalococcoidales bacterium]